MEKSNDFTQLNKNMSGKSMFFFLSIFNFVTRESEARKRMASALELMEMRGIFQHFINSIFDED